MSLKVVSSRNFDQKVFLAGFGKLWRKKNLIKKVFSSQSQNKLTPLFIFIFKPLLEFLIASNILLLTIATQTHLKTKLSVSTKEKN